MSTIWNQWEGQTLLEKFPLSRYLSGNDRAAVFLTQREENGRLTNAAIKIVSVDTDRAQQLLSRWQETAQLSHPNLVPVFESGKFGVDGGLYAFVVMDCADENLAQVVPGRALSVEEAREILGCVLKALSFLHEKKFVHGSIKPAHIMASGDQLKLASDALLRDGEMLPLPGGADAYAPPEDLAGDSSTAQPVSAASDMWSLGITLVEALTQKLPTSGTNERQDPIISKEIPQPFFDIASNCLRRNPRDRWTVAQVTDRLEGRMPVVQAAPVAKPAPVAHPAQVVPPAPVAVPVKPRATAVSQPPSQSVRPNVAGSKRPPAKSNRYVVPFALGFAVVVAGILVGPRILRHNSGASQPDAAADQHAQTTPALVETQPANSSSSDDRATASTKPTYAEQPSTSKPPAPVPALLHPDAVREEPANAAARVPMEPTANGQVTHRVMPQVLDSARKTIHGTVKVRVKVNVDRTGNVEDAELASRGPSRYFAKAAVQAAQQWKFNPPKVGDRGVLSTWILEFEFTRGQTTANSTQQLP